MGKKGKKQRTSTTSGGKRHQARARQQRRRLLMKIKRWERYRADEQKMSTGYHRGSGSEPWDIRGMQAHVKLLDKIIASPVKRP